MNWIVTKKQSLLEALEEMSPDSSKTTLRSWIAEGRIWLEGVQVKDPRKEVRPHNSIELEKKRQFFRNGMEIVYQDPFILVIYKPAGLLTVPTDTDLQENAFEWLKMEFRRRTIYPAHRLDQDASGILVFAFSLEAQEDLKKQFEEHAILREYLAVVEGSFLEKKGMWQSYLVEDGNFVVHSVKDPSKGKLATTHYEVIKEKDGASVLRVSLETGRKNQIRVHSSDVGHPILGDKKYGSKRPFHGRIAFQAFKL